jgi:hypothetical protein
MLFIKRQFWLPRVELAAFVPSLDFGSMNALLCAHAQNETYS